MSPLILDDTFEPYYAGRPGYTAKDTEKSRHAGKARAKPRGSEEQPGRTEGPECQPKRIRPEPE